MSQRLPDPTICYLCNESFGHARDDHGWWRCFPSWWRRLRDHEHGGRS